VYVACATKLNFFDSFSLLFFSIVTHSVNDFCRIVEAKLQNTPHSNGGSAASAPKIYVASTGVPINWADLREKVAGRQRSAKGRPPSANGVSANGSARHVGLHGGATGAGNSSKKNSGAARNPTHSRSSWGSAAAKRRREGGAGDSDSDGEATWAKALKESVYNERAEKAETFKQRRQAEQAALNQRFFETSRKKEEPVLGVDVSAPMLPEDMFPSDDEQSILDKVISISMHVCMYVYTNTHKYTHIYTHKHIHIHMNTQTHTH